MPQQHGRHSHRRPTAGRVNRDLRAIPRSAPRIGAGPPNDYRFPERPGIWPHWPGPRPLAGPTGWPRPASPFAAQSPCATRFLTRISKLATIWHVPMRSWQASRLTQPHQTPPQARMNAIERWTPCAGLSPTDTATANELALIPISRRSAVVTISSSSYSTWPCRPSRSPANQSLHSSG